MSRPKTPPSQETITIAERLLTQTFGSTIRLDGGDNLLGSDRSKVYRFQVLGGQGNAPTSVIVKQANSTSDAAYDPNSATIPAWTLFNDWAALQFLEQFTTSHTARLAPQFYCGDRASGLFIMEDLGSGKRLDQLLLGDDPLVAESALVEYAAVHGRLHALTVGRQEEFLHQRKALGPVEYETDYYDYTWLAPTLDSTANLLDIVPQQGTDAELATLTATLLNPGPFFAFNQGDSCPDNCIYPDMVPLNNVRPDHIRETGQAKMGMPSLSLLDFEGSKFKHALVEGVYGRMHFPTCWCVYRLPEHLPLRMEAAYRAELIKGCPAAADDTLFYHAVAEACALWMLDWYHEFPLATLLEKDRMIVTSTVRQRLLARSEILAQVTEEIGHMEAIGATVRAIATKLRTYWPEMEPLPYYPAFR